jgi:hypothetical protein
VSSGSAVVCAAAIRLTAFAKASAVKKLDPTKAPTTTINAEAPEHAA